MTTILTFLWLLLPLSSSGQTAPISDSLVQAELNWAIHQIKTSAPTTMRELAEKTARECMRPTPTDTADTDPGYDTLRWKVVVDTLVRMYYVGDTTVIWGRGLGVPPPKVFDSIRVIADTLRWQVRYVKADTVLDTTYVPRYPVWLTAEEIEVIHKIVDEILARPRYPVCSAFILFDTGAAVVAPRKYIEEDYR